VRALLLAALLGGLGLLPGAVGRIAHEEPARAPIARLTLPEPAPEPIAAPEPAVTLIPAPAAPAPLPRPIYRSTGGLLDRAVAHLKNALTVGQKYYVATNGSNGNVGSLASPWATVAYAATSGAPAAAGDTVFIRTGTYTQVVEFQKSGTAGNQIVFRPYGDGTVTIAPPLARDSIDHDGNAATPKVKDCTFDNGDPDPVVAVKILGARDRITLKGLTIIGGVRVEGIFSGTATGQWWTTSAPHPGRGATRDSVDAKNNFYSRMTTIFPGATWNPADSVLFDSLKVSEKGITYRLAQYGVLTNSEVGPVDCGVGPAVYVTFGSQFMRIESNYVHDTGVPDQGEAHWLVEGIRVAANAAYNRIYNNFGLRNASNPPSLAAQGSAAAFTFDAGAYFNTISNNTCEDAGRFCFHFQKFTRGNVWKNNLSRDANDTGFQWTSSQVADQDKAAAPGLTSFIPQYNEAFCNESRGVRLYDVQVNAAYRSLMYDNYWRVVNVYSGATNSGFWQTRENKWEGKTQPPLPVTGNAPIGLQNDTTDFKLNCGPTGSTLAVAGGQGNTGGVPEPPPPTGVGRADLWIPFETRDATNLLHPDRSKNAYHMSEPSGQVLLSADVTNDSTAGDSSGIFQGAAAQDYLYREISTSPAIKAYRDSLSIAGWVWMDSASGVAGTVIARNGTDKPWQVLGDSATSRLRLVYADSTTETNRSCGGGAGSTNTLIKETWHYFFVRYRTFAADSATSDVYYGRPGQTATTQQEHCVVVGNMHLSTGAPDNIGIGRSPNANTNYWTGRLDELYVTGRYLTKQQGDSIMMKGVARLEPAGNQAPSTPSVSAFAVVAGTKRDVNITGSAFSDPDNSGHKSSTWKITNTKLAAEIHSETNASAPLTSIRVNSRVEEGANYTAKVQYTDNLNAASALSAASATLHVPVTAPDSVNAVALSGTSARVTMFPATTRTDATLALQRAAGSAASCSGGTWTLVSDLTTMTRDVTGLTTNVWHCFRAKSKTPSVAFADADSSSATAVDSVLLSTTAAQFTDSLAFALFCERSTALASDSSGFGRHGAATGVLAGPGEFAGLRGAKSCDFRTASSSRITFADQSALQASSGLTAVVLVKRRTGTTGEQWLIGQRGSWALKLISNGTIPRLELTNTSGTTTVFDGTAIPCKSGHPCTASVDTLSRYIRATYDAAAGTGRIWVCEKNLTCALNKSGALAVGNLMDTTNEVSVGGVVVTAPSTYGWVTNGYIDEAAFWRNRALSDTDGQNIATSGLARQIRGTVGPRVPETPTGLIASDITEFGATLTVDTAAYHDPDGDKLTKTCRKVYLGEDVSPLYEECSPSALASFTWTGGNDGTTYYWQAAFEDSRAARSPFSAAEAFTTASAGQPPIVAVLSYSAESRTFFYGDQPQKLSNRQPYESYVLDFEFREVLADGDALNYEAGAVTAVDASGAEIAGFIGATSLDADQTSYLVRLASVPTFEGLATVTVNARAASGNVFSLPVAVQTRDSPYYDRLFMPQQTRARYAIDFGTGTQASLTAAAIAVVDATGASDSEFITQPSVSGRFVEFWIEATAEKGTWTARIRADASNGDKLEWDGYVTKK
jgi:hypothetical protein